MEIADPTPAERRVCAAFPLGEGVDLRESADDDPAAGAAWGPERTVRAEVLRALLVGGESRSGEIAGLKLAGARITGRLDLRYGVVQHSIRLRSCHFTEGPMLYGAQLRALVLSDSVLPALTAGALRVEGVLRMSRCRIAGPVRLAGSQIAGAIFLDGARLGVSPEAPDGPDNPDGSHTAPSGQHTPGTPDPDTLQEPALELNHVVVGNDIAAAGLVSHGQVRLNGAAVTGEVNLDDAVLHHPGHNALHAETLSVGTDLRAMRLRAHGRVNISGARIPRHLNLAYARLSNPGGQALRASSCVIGELWLRAAAPIEGTVNLRGCQADLLHIAPETWPDRVRIDGLSYRRLTPDLPAEQRLPLLEREESGYLPYAYEQLTAAYRTAGDDAAARTVQLAKLRRHRRTLPPYARAWGHLQDITVGYGFRPLRAAGWLLALLLTGAIAFTLDRPRPLKADEAPDFNPVFYTVDLLLPITDFGQQSAFAPQGWCQWLSYTLIVTGWILATTIAAGITRSLSRP
ncbi:membrane-associated oxidoreductase [Streptomyces sp. S465]|uniref:membrane-associated oxidoreductase n=1 Tax=Streptomyces sp. S465 TaxID=2979468 RepID=UPI0022A81731|nr:membrane-associated oxidoreductase [Streptomyces sp. S465]WAP56959.1 membrane-associated oxidoreductase [Streptomyces sp. S465]